MQVYFGILTGTLLLTYIVSFYRRRIRFEDLAGTGLRLRKNFHL